MISCIEEELKRRSDQNFCFGFNLIMKKRQKQYYSYFNALEEMHCFTKPDVMLNEEI